MVEAMNSKNGVWMLQPLLKALATHKSDAAINAIAKLLPSPLVRSEASQALRSYGPIAEDAVIVELRGQDKIARIEVCDILGMIGTEKSIPPLELAAKESRPVRG